MKNRNYLLLFTAVATLNGCVPPLYHASVTNTPMFSKKGELSVTGAYGKSGTDLQAAYSVSNSSAVMFNCSYGNKIQTDIDSGSALTTNNTISNTTFGNTEYKNGYRYNFMEAGYGIYLKPKNGSDLRAEVFGLIGTGYAESFNELIDYSTSGNYMRYSVQGNFGYAGKITDGILSLRIGYLDFSRLSESENNKIMSVANEAPSSQNLLSNGKTTSFFIDPAVTFRLGYKGIKLFLQSGISIPLSNHLNFGWDKSWGSIGVQCRINTGK